jgi:hypothetical protein
MNKKYSILLWVLLSSTTLFTAEKSSLLEKNIRFQDPLAQLAMKVLLRESYKKIIEHPPLSYKNFETLPQLKIGDTITTSSWNHSYTENFFQVYVRGRNIKLLTKTPTGNSIWLVTATGPIEFTQLYWRYVQGNVMQNFKKKIVEVTE